ncbi:MAG: hypothetical protein IJ056_09355 [Acidaminococcaceae bacterium]|nr:hypothetical protein [Acidaminococcaceae bacterium]
MKRIIWVYDAVHIFLLQQEGKGSELQGRLILADQMGERYGKVAGGKR